MSWRALSWSCGGIGKSTLIGVSRENLYLDAYYCACHDFGWHMFWLRMGRITIERPFIVLSPIC